MSKEMIYKNQVRLNLTAMRGPPLTHMNLPPTALIATLKDTLRAILNRPVRLGVKARCVDGLKGQLAALLQQQQKAKVA